MLLPWSTRHDPMPATAFFVPDLIEGRVVGTWTRKLKRNAVVISPEFIQGHDWR